METGPTIVITIAVGRKKNVTVAALVFVKSALTFLWEKEQNLL